MRQTHIITHRDTQNNTYTYINTFYAYGHLITKWRRRAHPINPERRLISANFVKIFHVVGLHVSGSPIFGGHTGPLNFRIGNATLSRRWLRLRCWQWMFMYDSIFLTVNIHARIFKAWMPFQYGNNINWSANGYCYAEGGSDIMAVITPKILHVRSSNLCPNWDLEIFPTRKSAKMLFLSLISFRGHFEKRSHITLWDHIRFPWQNFDSVRTSTPAKVVCEKKIRETRPKPERTALCQ